MCVHKPVCVCVHVHVYTMYVCMCTCTCRYTEYSIRNMHNYVHVCSSIMYSNNTFMCMYMHNVQSCKYMYVYTCMCMG